MVDALSPGLTSENAHPQFGREPGLSVGVETDPVSAAPTDSSFSNNIVTSEGQAVKEHHDNEGGILS